MATDVESLSTAVGELWVGADSTKGRQVLACQIDACYKVLVKSINGLIGTLYNIAASWEYSQKNSSFGGDAEATADTDIPTTAYSYCPNLTAPEPQLATYGDGQGGGSNEDAIEAWNNIIEGTDDDGTAYNTADTIDIVADGCSIGAYDTFTVEPDASITDYINGDLSSESFDYTDSTTYGIDESIDATPNFQQIESTINGFAEGIAGLNLDGYVGSYSDSLKTWLSSLQSSIEEMSASVNDLNNLVTSAVTSYTESSTQIGSSLSDGQSS